MKKQKLNDNKDDTKVEVDNQTIEALSRLINVVSKETPAKMAMESEEEGIMKSLIRTYYPDKIYLHLHNCIGNIVSETYIDEIERIRLDDRNFKYRKYVFFMDSTTSLKFNVINDILHLNRILDIEIEATSDNKLSITILIDTESKMPNGVLSRYFNVQQCRKFDFEQQSFKEEALSALNANSKFLLKRLIPILNLDVKSEFPLLEQDPDCMLGFLNGSIFIKSPIHLFQLKQILMDPYFHEKELIYGPNKTIELKFQVHDVFYFDE